MVRSGGRGSEVDAWRIGNSAGAGKVFVVAIQRGHRKVMVCREMGGIAYSRVTPKKRRAKLSNPMNLEYKDCYLSLSSRHLLFKAELVPVAVTITESTVVTGCISSVIQNQWNLACY